MEKAPGTTSTIFNKIIIPVITTVLGATAIYFLGFNKKGGRSDMEAMLLTKEATVKAWKSFVTLENIAYKNMNSISEEYAEKLKEAVAEKGMKGSVSVLNDFKTDLFKELKKSNDDMREILKNPDIDEGFVSMLNRALENGKDEEKRAVVFFNDIISLARGEGSDQDKLERWQKMAKKFESMEERSNERSANEAEEIAKTLSERYGQAFDLNQLQVYVDYKKEKEGGKNNDGDDNNKKGGNAGNDSEKAPGDPNATTDDVVPVNEKTNDTRITTAMLTGTWNMPTGGYLKLSANGDMYWTFESKGYTSGTWKLVEDKIQMKAKNPDTGQTSLLVGFLTDVTENSFTMTFMSTPKEIYKFRKKD